MCEIETAFNKVMSSGLFRTDGDPFELQMLMNLAHAILENETDESTWSMGEFLECSLSDLIPGAYWALTECHAGQNSESYATMCALGQVFRPGASSGPEPDTGEQVAYEQLVQHLIPSS